jgi:probable rRNA maturation factor
MSDPIEISLVDRKWSKTVPMAERICRRFARAALAAPGPFGARSPTHRRELRIALGDDRAAHDLNRRFRGIDKPTNVLSFPAHGTDTDRGADPQGLGDIMIAYETTAAEAKVQGIAVADHLAHLVVHGVLHLRGYDHERAGDAEAMETLETDILVRFGVADPYAGTDAELPS